MSCPAGQDLWLGPLGPSPEASSTWKYLSPPSPIPLQTQAPGRGEWRRVSFCAAVALLLDTCQKVKVSSRPLGEPCSECSLMPPPQEGPPQDASWLWSSWVAGLAQSI